MLRCQCYCEMFLPTIIEGDKDFKVFYIESCVSSNQTIQWNMIVLYCCNCWINEFVCNASFTMIIFDHISMIVSDHIHLTLDRSNVIATTDSNCLNVSVN